MRDGPKSIHNIFHPSRKTMTRSVFILGSDGPWVGEEPSTATCFCFCVVDVLQQKEKGKKKWKKMEKSRECMKGNACHGLHYQKYYAHSFILYVP
jgi:hypothetical protein